MLRLSEAVFRQAQKSPPRSKRILMVINPNDKAVNEAAIHSLIALWNRGAPGRVQLREFRADLNLIHDLIDPAQKDQRVNVVYPALEHWINTVR
jgi:carboxylesterase